MSCRAFLLFFLICAPYYEDDELVMMSFRWCQKGKPATHFIKHEWNRNECNTQESQRRTRPRDSKVVIHSSREQRESRAERTSHEIIACKHTSRILGVGVREVIEHRVEEEEGSEGKEGGADDGHDPGEMGACVGGPAEPEEADRNAEGADEGRG